MSLPNLVRLSLSAINSQNGRRESFKLVETNRVIEVPYLLKINDRRTRGQLGPILSKVRKNSQIHNMKRTKQKNTKRTNQIESNLLMQKGQLATNNANIKIVQKH